MVHSISCSAAYSITHISSLRHIHDLIPHFFSTIENEMREKMKTTEEKQKKNILIKIFCANFSCPGSSQNRNIKRVVKSKRWMKLSACMCKFLIFIYSPTFILAVSLLFAHSLSYPPFKLIFRWSVASKMRPVMRWFNFTWVFTFFLRMTNRL